VTTPDKFYRNPKTNDWTIEVHNPNGPNWIHAVMSRANTTLEEVKPMLLEWKRDKEEWLRD
jgi:hypothetical protein